MEKEFFQKSSHLKLILMLVFIAFVLLMLGNGMVSLTHPDEVFYAQTAKEMIAHNNWLTPVLFDQPHFEKPIFFFWLLALNVKIFGLHPFWVRFWPAFFGILGVGVTYWISWMMFRNKRTSFYSGLVLATSFIYLALSRAVLTDMVFSVIVAISVGSFYLSYFNRQYKKIGILLWLAFCGLAVLTKGVLGLCFCIVSVLSFLIYKRDIGFLKSQATLQGLVLLTLIAVPWHIIMYSRYGQWFLDEYFQNVHVRRLFDAEHPKNNTWYFYLMILFAGIMPWSLFTLPSGYFTFRNIKHAHANKDQLVFLLLWIFCTLIFIQPAASKLASYIFPAFPALAIIVGRYLDCALDNQKHAHSEKTFAAIGYVMVMLFGAGSIAAIYFGHKHIDIIGNINPVYVFSALCILYAALMLILNLKKKYPWMIFVNSSITMIVLLTLLLGRSHIEPWVSCKHISVIFNEMETGKERILASKFYARGVRYYTGREIAVMDVGGKGYFSPHPIPTLTTRKKVLDFLHEHKKTYGIVKAGDIHNLGWVMKGHFTLKQLSNIGGKFIVVINEIPGHPE